MPASLGLLRANDRAEVIHLPKRRGRCFTIELSALGQIGRLMEVLRRKPPRGSLESIRRENRGIDQCKSAIIENVSKGANNFVANSKDGMSPAGTQLEMAMFHENPVPCSYPPGARATWRNIPVTTRLDSYTSSADRANYSSPTIPLADHGLNVSGSIPKNQEMQLPFVAPTAEPATNRYLLPGMSGRFIDVDHRHARSFRCEHCRISPWQGA